MKINIVGLGSTAKHWDGIGTSIGVNDCKRLGFDPTYLLIVNTANQFTFDRLEFIKATKPHKLFTDQPDSWGKWFPDIPVVPINSRAWSHSNRLQKISKNYLYHSKTSPFLAISMAFSWGFTEIILWGVDMVDHHRYKPGEGAFLNEYASYKSFCASLKEAGCNVYLGHEGSNLKFLPIWQK
jgi:hypothetical protein